MIVSLHPLSVAKSSDKTPRWIHLQPERLVNESMTICVINSSICAFKKHCTISLENLSHPKMRSPNLYATVNGVMLQELLTKHPRCGSQLKSVKRRGVPEARPLKNRPMFHACSSANPRLKSTTFPR